MRQVRAAGCKKAIDKKWGRVMRRMARPLLCGALALLACGPAQSQTIPQVSGNAALRALSATQYPSVMRLGFAAAGDGGQAIYRPSSDACSFNGGNGDDGAQVRSADGKCWIADFGGMQVTPMVWGAKGDGAADDTAPVQAAINAVPALWLGDHLYRVAPLRAAKTLSIHGPSGTSGVYHPDCAHGLKVASATEDLLTLNGDGSVVERVCFQMGNAVNRQTAGAAITVAAADGVVIKENQINFPFKGVVVGGATDGVSQVNRHTQTNSTLVHSNVIVQPSNGGVGIEIGRMSTGGSTVGTVLRDNSIACFGTSATGIAHYDSAGSFQNNPNGPYACNIGTSLTPGGTDASHRQQSQLVTEGDVLGDSSASHDLLVDTLSASGLVWYTRFENSWASAVVRADNSVLVRNTGGGKIQSITFSNFTSHSGNGTVPIIDIEAGSNITISNSEICADGGQTTATGIRIGAAARSINILGNRIGTCWGTLTTGVEIVRGANILNINGNNFDSTTTPLLFSANNETALITNNMGLDNIAPTQASAASVALPVTAKVIITGTTTISTLVGTWSNRQVTILPTGALPFTTGGNICNALTAAADVPVHALWDAGRNCWHLK